MPRVTIFNVSLLPPRILLRLHLRHHLHHHFPSPPPSPTQIVMVLLFATPPLRLSFSTSYTAMHVSPTMAKHRLRPAALSRVLPIIPPLRAAFSYTSRAANLDRLLTSVVLMLLLQAPPLQYLRFLRPLALLYPLLHPYFLAVRHIARIRLRPAYVVTGLPAKATPPTLCGYVLPPSISPLPQVPVCALVNDRRILALLTPSGLSFGHVRAPILRRMWRAALLRERDAVQHT